MTVQKIQQLASIGAYIIDVKCALEVLKKREQERKDRPIGAAKVHVEFCYGFEKNDCEVDTSATDSMTCAQQIKNSIENHPPLAFTQIVKDHKCTANFSLFEKWNSNQ